LPKLLSNFKRERSFTKLLSNFKRLS